MLARKSAVIVAGNLLGAVLGLVILKLATTYFGTGAFGSVGFALAIVGLFELFSDFGFSRAAVKRMSEGRDVGRALATYRAVKLALVALMVLLVLAALGVWTVVLGRPIVTTNLSVILVALAYAGVRALVPTQTVVFEARQESAKFQVAALAENVVRLPLVAVLAFAAGAAVNRGPWTNAPPALVRLVADHRAEALAFTYFVGSVATLLAAVWLGRGVRGTVASRASIASLWRFAAPIFASGISAVLSGYLDRVAIGFYADEAQVAYYFAAQRLTSVLQFIPLAVAMLLFPTISGHDRVRDATTIRTVADRAERYTGFFVTPSIVFFLFLSEPIINVFLQADASDASA